VKSMRGKSKSNCLRVNYKQLFFMMVIFMSLMGVTVGIMTVYKEDRLADENVFSVLITDEESKPDKEEVYSIEEGDNLIEEEDNWDNMSSFTNLDGTPYIWQEHAYPESKGLIYIHDHKEMLQPEGKRAQEWLKHRCQGFELNLEGKRSGQCYGRNSHPLVVDQRICKATRSDKSYAEDKKFWAVSKTNPLHAEEKYTLVVPAFLRVDALLESIRVFSHCKELASYHIVWGNLKQSPPMDLIQNKWLKLTDSLRSEKPFLHVHLMSVDTLNSRYLDLPGITTKAVVHVDDDQTTRCSEMKRFLTAWRAYPQQLVSPHVRAFSCYALDGAESILVTDGIGLRRGFNYWGPVEEPFRGFECALTKFAMAHRCFSAVYSYGLEHHEGHKAGKAMVNRYLNGEDILFQGTASLVTGLPPVFLQGIEIIDNGVDDGLGISTRRKSNHFRAREQILGEVTKYLGFTWISQDFKIPKAFVTPDRPCPEE